MVLSGREGYWGMVSVDVIGRVRRAYFERRLPIKEIVRTLSVSRATVRKIIRSHKTEFKYERGEQPAPKLGEWVDILTEILEKEGKLPRRERRSTQRLFEELRGRGYDELHLRRGLREIQRGRLLVCNMVQDAKGGMADRAKAEAALRDFDRCITFAVYALSHLPPDPGGRLAALADALANLETTDKQ